MSPRISSWYAFLRVCYTHETYVRIALTAGWVQGTLRRTEKMLCACASGSWVLQPSYLYAPALFA